MGHVDLGWADRVRVHAARQVLDDSGTSAEGPRRIVPAHHGEAAHEVEPRVDPEHDGSAQQLSRDMLRRTDRIVGISWADHPAQRDEAAVSEDEVTDRQSDKPRQAWESSFRGVPEDLPLLISRHAVPIHFAHATQRLCLPAAKIGRVR